MRTTGLILFFISFISLKAQTQTPVTAGAYSEQGAFTRYHLRNDSTDLTKKWSVGIYGGMAAGIGFFNGGSSAFAPAQIGLQVNRRLTKNLYAFGGVAITPVIFNFNRSFSNADPYKSYMTNPGFGANGFGIYQGIQAGLMYVNDEKTFSVSGSFGISSSRYPAYPSNSFNTQKQPLRTRQ